MPATSALHVLLVDDDETDAQRIFEMLQRQPGFGCDLEPSLHRAEQALASRNYHAVLFSLSLNEYAGLAGLALLQALAPRFPVIAIATPAQEMLALKAMQQGAADHLVRGQIYPTVLERSIRHAVEVKRAQELQAQTERALQWERDFSNTVI